MSDTHTQAAWDYGDEAKRRPLNPTRLPPAAEEKSEMGEDDMETYDIVSSDPEIQTIYICIEALERHEVDFETQRRIVRYLHARYCQESP